MFIFLFLIVLILIVLQKLGIYNLHLFFWDINAAHFFLPVLFVLIVLHFIQLFSKIDN
jgi:hypothetical protein